MEGFFMTSISVRARRRDQNAELIADTFLCGRGLPFAEVLPTHMIEAVFREHDAWFGSTYNAIYNTAIVLWAFLSQTLSDGKSRSCSAAVMRVIGFLMSIGKAVPSTNTGDYCAARAKLSVDAIRELLSLVDRNTLHVGSSKWLWEGRHAKLVDGFTATMADTPENQAAFPQVKKQKPGVGFPILRACIILSLATACVTDAAIGPYCGKETGETALLREMPGSFASGDIAVFDRHYSSYMTLALLMIQGVDVCTRMHHLRKHSKKVKRLGKNDYLAIWDRPQRPGWMDPTTYDRIPKTLTLRVITYSITSPGCRVKKLTAVTSLLDSETYSSEKIAELYGHRWNVELDIRDIKQTLNLDHMRCKTPQRVRLEFYTTLLAYNLVRQVICQAADFHGVLPRRISFTRTCEYLLAFWPQLALGQFSPKTLEKILTQIASLKIPDRPNRIEPRVLKRRPLPYQLMTQPRQTLRKKIKSGKIKGQKGD
jgi:hypothetical protein